MIQNCNKLNIYTTIVAYSVGNNKIRCLGHNFQWNLIRPTLFSFKISMKTHHSLTCSNTQQEKAKVNQFKWLLSSKEVIMIFFFFA